MDAVKYLNERKDGEYNAHCLGLIGKNYIYLNNVDSAIFYYNKLLKLSRAIKSFEFEAFALQVIGTL